MHSLDRSLALSPTVQAYLLRARCRPKSDLSGRRSDVDAASKLEPHSPAVLLGLAEVQSDTGQYREAQQNLAQVIAAVGETPDLLITRGILYARTSQRERAEKDFALARSKAGDADALNEMCWSLATAGVALDTALSACESAVAQNPRQWHYQDSRGFVLMRLGRYDAAIASYDAAVELSADSSISLYGRGLAKRLKGDVAGADADMEVAQRLDAHVATIYADFGIRP